MMRAIRSWRASAQVCAESTKHNALQQPNSNPRPLPVHKVLFFFGGFGCFADVWEPHHQGQVAFDYNVLLWMPRIKAFFILGSHDAQARGSIFKADGKKQARCARRLL